MFQLRGENLDVEPVHDGPQGHVLQGRALTAGDCEPGEILPDSLDAFVALIQHKPFWVSPMFGDSVADLAQVDSEVFLLLWRQTNGSYGIALPTVVPGVRAALCGGEEGARVLAHVDDDAPETAPLVLIDEDPDPYELRRRTFDTLSATLGTFRTRRNKSLPPWLEYLGWCTWDAFYQDVDAEGVRRGLTSLQAGGVRPGFMILDDGWQSVTEGKMTTFTPNPEKFPDGLDPLIREVKDAYGVLWFGVWHTLAGYWRGVHPAGEIARQFTVRPSAEPFKFTDDGEPIHGHAVDPAEAESFFATFYEKLAQAGVDMTKVDNQTSQARFAPTQHGRDRMVRSYQKGLQKAANDVLGGHVLHCMCNRNDVAYRMQHSVMWRNSDDFFPNRPESHTEHVFSNALNNLWSEAFAIPDWDMFHSSHPAGAFHATARAISGGPVYISDEPDKHDFDLLRSLCTTNGRVLRCREPALPTPDRLFVDCRREAKLLKVFNRNGDHGAVGLFHCRHSESGAAEPIEDAFGPGDVPGLPGQRFAAWGHHRASGWILEGRSEASISLAELGCEFITLAPIEYDCAVLGLVDKINAAAALLSWSRPDSNVLRAELCDGGRIGFYAEGEPHAVTVNGEQVTPIPLEPRGFWAVEAPEGGECTLEVRL